MQNFPVLEAATNTPTGLTVAGSLNSLPSSAYELDFFCNSTGDATGNGEGEANLGSTTASTLADGNAAFVVALPAQARSRYITATATDAAGNSSEFSPWVRAESTVPPLMYTVVNTSDSGPGSLRQALLDASGYPAGAAHTIAFNIPGVGPHTTAPSSALPSPTEAVIVDGYTQPGASPNTLALGNNAVLQIQLDGRAAGNSSTGLALPADGNVVRGLAFGGWYVGIELLGGGQIWDQDTDDAESVRTIQAALDLGTLTYMSLEQGLLTGKIGMERVFQPGEFRSNTFWNDWLIPANRRRVLDLLASWRDLTDKYACTLSQLVIAWTAAQPGVTHVLAGGRNIAQATENAKAGELNLGAADLARIRKDVIALGEPVKT